MLPLILGFHGQLWATDFNPVCAVGPIRLIFLKRWTTALNVRGEIEKTSWRVNKPSSSKQSGYDLKAQMEKLHGEKVKYCYCWLPLLHVFQRVAFLTCAFLVMSSWASKPVCFPPSRSPLCLPTGSDSVWQKLQRELEHLMEMHKVVAAKSVEVGSCSRN